MRLDEIIKDNMILEDKYIKRFWNKVNIRSKDECWEWKASTARGGYGQFSIGVKVIRAHQLAWALTNGRMPKSGMEICHDCDNPLCCNPNHLWEGTKGQNMKDAINKGRKLLPNSPLSSKQIYNIRNAKGRLKDIAVQFNVTKSTASRIKNRIYYANL